MRWPLFGVGRQRIKDSSLQVQDPLADFISQLTNSGQSEFYLLIHLGRTRFILDASESGL